ncbi:MAG: LysM peptidoglycan-binding domain-containing protein [Anaerolineae bacterium]|nr:LysM peptidoglycan-binding domain-containing protein [Anaerolineae bacterium]
MSPQPLSRRLLPIWLVLLLVLGLALPALSVSAQAGSVAAVNTGRLNVRTGPGVQFPAITSLPLNTQVILVGRAPSSTWVEVQIPDGRRGWVNSILIRTYADLSLLPITYSPPATPPPILVTPPPNPGQPGPTVYVVRAGDTLKDIAARYGTTWQILAAVNGLVNPNRIFAGQRLIIAYSVPTVPPPSQPQPGGGVHIVQAGETLQIIAARYGTTWQAIAAANSLSNANQIFVGQRLVIPTTPAQPRYYTVQRGDTLFSIATRYGVTIQALSVANNLANPNQIYVGQRLVIP